MNCGIIVLLILFSLGLLYLVGFSIYKLFFKNTKSVLYQTNKQKRMELSSKYHGNKLNKCNTYSISNSPGILFDESIVCNALRHVKATPFFYFENFDNYANMNDWIFVNLDCTNFNSLKDINSPNNILCKNRQTLDILSKELSPKKNILYTGFTSIDKFKPEIKKNYKKLIHISGKSPHKGTLYLIDAWLKHKEWPVLTIICNNTMSLVNNINKILKGKEYDNIKLITNFISENDIIKYMNEYGVHICTSEFEGFGHSSNEARSTEAVVLYTDMQCFQERFKDGISGIAVKSQQNGFKNKICPKYKPRLEGIENAVNKILNMTDDDLSKIGKQARIEFVKDDIEFKNRLTSLVKGTNPIPYIIHNMWISKDTPYENVKIPEKYVKNIKTLYDNNKNFKFMYWSGKDILELITNNYPEYLDFYKQLEPNICKCDFARFVVVAIYGGLYIDLDFYCKRNISELLTCDSYFIYEPNDKHGTDHKHLFNGIFAACKKNPFVLGWMEQMKKNKDMGEGEVMKKTGPIGLYNYYKNNKNKVLFGNSCDFLSIIDNNKFSEQCSGNYNNYATTLWYEGSDWGGEKKPSDNIKFISVKNPIDGTDMLWEKSKFTKKNWPGLDYDIEEKKAIFQHAKKNKPKYGVIDVGAHIGDLSIPLALALKNIGRSDIIVYAIDPSQEKCDFIEKMSLINSVSNIRILNYGLSDSEKILGHEILKENIDNFNTGAQKWDTKNANVNLTNTYESESNIFIPADTLFKKGEIGPVGIYHIDVEGHEVDVLKGSKNLINTFKPLLFIENYISKDDKCKNKDDCPLLFKTIQDINPSYKHTGFLPNGDLIFHI